MGLLNLYNAFSDINKIALLFLLLVILILPFLLIISHLLCGVNLLFFQKFGSSVFYCYPQHCFWAVERNCGEHCEDASLASHFQAVYLKRSRLYF